MFISSYLELISYMGALNEGGLVTIQLIASNY
jgi:hypothetical protein